MTLFFVLLLMVMTFVGKNRCMDDKYRSVVIVGGLGCFLVVIALGVLGVIK